MCGHPHTSSAHLFSFERARAGAGPRYSNLAAVPWGSLLGSCAGTAAAARQLCVVCLCVVRAPMTPNTASGGTAYNALAFCKVGAGASSALRASVFINLKSGMLTWG